MLQIKTLYTIPITNKAVHGVIRRFRRGRLSTSSEVEHNLYEINCPINLGICRIIHLKKAISFNKLNCSCQTASNISQCQHYLARN